MARLSALAASACAIAALLPASALAAGEPAPSATKPTITGTLRAGSAVTASTGSWTNSPTSYRYEWEVCDRYGDCSYRTTMTSAYTIDDWAGGGSVAVFVTAINGNGPSATTNDSIVYEDLTSPRPLSITAPSMEFDEAAVGEWAWTDGGDWRYDLGYDRDYQWERSADGLHWTAIPDATESEYQFTDADVGMIVHVVVTAHNVSGASTLQSWSQDSGGWTVRVARPWAEVDPTITGVAAREGELLTAQPGSWRGVGPIALSYYWERCNTVSGDCSGIWTGPTYRLTSADVGSQVDVRVEATNAGGTRYAWSNLTSVVVPRAYVAPPDASAPIAVLKTTKHLPKLAKALTSGITLQGTCSELCTVTGQLTVDAKTAKKLKLGRSRVVGSVNQTLTTAGGTLKVGFDKKAAKKLKRAHTLKLTLTAAVRDAAGNSRPLSVKLTLKR